MLRVHITCMMMWVKWEGGRERKEGSTWVKWEGWREREGGGRRSKQQEKGCWFVCYTLGLIYLHRVHWSGRSVFNVGRSRPPFCSWWQETEAVHSLLQPHPDEGDLIDQVWKGSLCQPVSTPSWLYWRETVVAGSISALWCQRSQDRKGGVVIFTTGNKRGFMFNCRMTFGVGSGGHRLWGELHWLLAIVAHAWACMHWHILWWKERVNISIVLGISLVMMCLMARISTVTIISTWHCSWWTKPSSLRGLLGAQVRKERVKLNHCTTAYNTSRP